MIDEDSYLIGLFDGEGCISASGPSREGNWHLRVSVEITDEATVRTFRARWGGQICRRKRREGYRLLWRWQLNGTKAIPFLELTSQQARIKRRQAEIALLIARDMLRYIDGSGWRRGTRVSAGGSYLSDKQKALRTDLVLEMRGLNGARSRFAPDIAP